MAKKRASRSTFHPAAFSGWTDYRYGARRKVTLAPILKDERRERVIDTARDVLRRWTMSPFEHEADLVHGLRSGLCLDGHRFARAEAEAETIVAEALRILGAKRPSWEEGQPSYVEPRENCAHCGRAIPDDHHVGVKAWRYCSDVCAKADLERRDFERRDETDRVYAAAYRTIRRSRSAPRECVQCGASFQPVREAGTQRFCSQKCGARHSAALRCETPPTIDRVCECCGGPFKARDVKARFCSGRCSEIPRLIKKGTPPARISPPVFDYVFRLAA